jgi:OOP family OmpA-OmpF porin
MKPMTKIFVFFAAVLFFFGCAGKMPLNLPEFNAANFDTDNYTSKVDTFLVLFDASSSMGFDNKFEIAKAVAERMNATVPALAQTAGIRSFGHSPNVSAKDTELFYGMSQYNKTNFQAGLDKITEPGGPSPMSSAINEAVKDFDGFEGGRNAVIFITDGLDLPADVLSSAKNLKATYGDSMCFYTVLVGDNFNDGNKSKSAALLSQITSIGKCGQAFAAEDLLTSDGMANFVETVFLDPKAVAAAPKPAAPAPSDADNDGVMDADDQCPNTPVGAPVTSAGCWVLDNVLFDFDKAEIKPAAYGILNDAAAILNKNPKMNIELHGHCDNVGTEQYNMDLSLRRANAVKTYMNSKGVVLSRMETKGFGYNRPIESNDTEMGRSQNRRVELHPIY